MMTLERDRRILPQADLSKINFSDPKQQFSEPVQFGEVRAKDGEAVNLEALFSVSSEFAEIQVRPEQRDKLNDRGEYYDCIFRMQPVPGSDGRWELFHRRVSRMLRRNNEVDLTGWLFGTAERIIAGTTKARREKGVLELSLSQPALLLSVRKRGYVPSETNPLHQIERAQAFLQEIDAGERLESPRFYMPDPSAGSRFLIVAARQDSSYDPVIVDKTDKAYNSADFQCTSGQCLCTNEDLRVVADSDVHDSVLRVTFEKKLENLNA